MAKRMASIRRHNFSDGFFSSQDEDVAKEADDKGGKKGNVIGGKENSSSSSYNVNWCKNSESESADDEGGRRTGMDNREGRATPLGVDIIQL